MPIHAKRALHHLAARGVCRLAHVLMILIKVGVRVLKIMLGIFRAPKPLVRMRQKARRWTKLNKSVISWKPAPVTSARPLQVVRGVCHPVSVLMTLK